jgi:phosphoribosylanthranilate isomerase
MRGGADVLGFVAEYPVPVPWNISRETAKGLIERVPPPFKTCLVTGGAPEKIIALAEYARPSLVQLHYNETLSDTAQIARALMPLGIEVIKTLPLTEDGRMGQFGISGTEAIADALCESGIYAILIDARTASNAASADLKADNKLFLEVKSRIETREKTGLSVKRVILAGGITPKNAGEILARTGADFIDVMTGAEKIRGVKDAALVAELLKNISEYSAQ